MAIFVGLIVPLPFTVKRKLFTFISESPVVAKLQYGMKVRPPQAPTPTVSATKQSRNLTPEPQITFIFILILFIDSVNRVYRVQIELTGFDAANSGYVHVTPP